MNFGQKYDRTADALDQHLCSGKAELLWESYRLAITVLEELGRFHESTVVSMKYISTIYIHKDSVKRTVSALSPFPFPIPPSTLAQEVVASAALTIWAWG